MEKYSTFAEFNKYIQVSPPKNEDLDVGEYLPSTKLKSSGILIDFYRVSFKTNYVNPDTPGFDPNNPKPITAVFFNSPGNVYKWDMDDKFEGYYLQMSNDLIQNHRYLFQSYLEYGQHEALFLNKSEEAEIVKLYQFLLEKSANSESSFNINLAYTNLILNLVESFYKRQFSTDVEKYNYIVREFQQHLREYYSQGNAELPSVQFFADKMKLSPNYLGDVIKAHTHKSAKETINEFVLAQAKKMLLETHLSSTEIAFELGFSYPNYFGKFFKKQMQMTPKGFREKMKISV